MWIVCQPQLVATQPVELSGSWPATHPETLAVEKPPLLNVSATLGPLSTYPLKPPLDPVLCHALPGATQPIEPAVSDLRDFLLACPPSQTMDFNTLLPLYSASLAIEGGSAQCPSHPLQIDSPKPIPSSKATLWDATPVPTSQSATLTLTSRLSEGLALALAQPLRLKPTPLYKLGGRLRLQLKTRLAQQTGDSPVNLDLLSVVANVRAVPSVFRAVWDETTQWLCLFPQKDRQRGFYQRKATVAGYWVQAKRRQGSPTVVAAVLTETPPQQGRSSP